VTTTETCTPSSLQPEDGMPGCLAAKTSSGESVFPVTRRLVEVSPAE